MKLTAAIIFPSKVLKFLLTTAASFFLSDEREYHQSVVPLVPVISVFGYRAGHVVGYPVV